MNEESNRDIDIVLPVQQQGVPGPVQQFLIDYEADIDEVLTVRYASGAVGTQDPDVISSGTRPGLVAAISDYRDGASDGTSGGNISSGPDRPVYVVTGANPADLLALGPLARLVDARVLLVDDLDVQLQGRSGPDTQFIVVGGTAAVPAAVQRDLQELDASNFVERIAGANRYDTAALIALLQAVVVPELRNEAGYSPVTLVAGLVCADDAADAVNAAPYTAGHGYLVVTDTDRLAVEAAEAMDAHTDGLRVQVFGGTAAISDATAAAAVSAAQQ